MDFFVTKRDEMNHVLDKLPLKDVVQFHYGITKKIRELMITRSRVLFEGEPFFMHFSPLDAKPSYYAFSTQKWVQLLLPTAGLPVSCRHLLPISSSGGLLLFTGVPGSCRAINPLRQWWPLVVLNPINRENRFILFMLELPPQLEDAWYPQYYSDLLMGIKANGDSKTYKVVVHWKNRNVVQIYDSGSHEWSTVLAPRELETYANASNEIVQCRSYGLNHAIRSSVYDIRHGKLVDCSFREDSIFREGLRVSNVNPLTARESTIVGESCLYALSYNVFPTTYVRIHKKERRSNWQLLTEAPLRDLLNFTENLRTDRALHLYECGNHLLFAVSRNGIWGGALYDLEKQVWDQNFIVNRNPASPGPHYGLFFQPQLHGPQL